MEENKCCQAGSAGGKGCGCMCHKSIPILIVLIAIAILLGNLGILGQGFVGIVWPILLGLIGLNKMCGGKCKCC